LAEQANGAGIDVHISKTGGEIQVPIQAFDHFLVFCRAIFDDWLSWGSSHPSLFTLFLLVLLAAFAVACHSLVDMMRMKREFERERRETQVQLSLQLPVPYNDDSADS